VQLLWYAYSSLTDTIIFRFLYTLTYLTLTRRSSVGKIIAGIFKSSVYISGWAAAGKLHNMIHYTGISLCKYTGTADPVLTKTKRRFLTIFLPLKQRAIKTHTF